MLREEMYLSNEKILDAPHVKTHCIYLLAYLFMKTKIHYQGNLHFSWRPV